MRRLAAAAAVACTVVIAAVAPAAATVESDAEALIATYTNDLRAEKSLDAFGVSYDISQVSDAWSESQLPAVVSAWKKYLGGSSLNVPLEHNPNFASQMPSGWTRAAENVAWACGYGSASSAAKAIQASWEKSPGHYANLVGNYTDFGVGFAYDDATGCAYGTQNFGYYTPRLVQGDPTIFVDITTASQGAEAIEWIGTQGIATGFADGTYRPLDSVTRRQMALFMFRYAGEPVAGSDPDFADVDEVSKGYEAISWVGVEGIATGFQDGTYRPLQSVTRRQMALFMYRYAGEPDYPVPSVSPYTDVKPGDKGYEAIAWLDYAGVATGFKDGSFRPLADVTRRQMALFMHRYSS